MKWTRFRSAGRLFGTIAVALLMTLVATPTLRAQSPTPEGTVITNTASVSFTDANGNTYSAVTASVSVTVGFVAGVDVAGAASATPASPSSANTLTFTIQNIGNGTDKVQVAEAISVGGVITVTSYVYNATTYATLAALNTALSGANITQGSTITVQVKYDVAANKGGVATNYTLTGTSVRDNAVTDNQVTTITPTQTYAVAVTPAVAALIDSSDPDDPIARQYIPSVEELNAQPEENADPIGDHAHSVIPQLQRGRSRA